MTIWLDLASVEINCLVDVNFLATQSTSLFRCFVVYFTFALNGILKHYLFNIKCFHNTDTRISVFMRYLSRTYFKDSFLGTGP